MAGGLHSLNPRGSDVFEEFGGGVDVEIVMEGEVDAFSETGGVFNGGVTSTSGLDKWSAYTFPIALTKRERETYMRQHRMPRIPNQHHPPALTPTCL